MTRTAAIKAKNALPSHEYVREKIVAIAMAGELGVLQFTGDGETPGCVYRDDDVTVVWMGGMTCVAVPSSGPSLTLRIADEGEDLVDVTERMCEEADAVMITMADAYRIALHRRDVQGY